MSLKLATLAASQHGVFLRRQAIECGCSPEEIRQHVRKKEWTAIRRGAYVATATWNSMDRAQRYRALCHAVAAKIGDGAVLSHTSAVSLHRLPTWGHDLTAVHVSRARTSRIEGGVVHHRSPVPIDLVAHRSGLAVSAVTRALLETALISPHEACVPTFDAALHEGLTTNQELLDVLEPMRDWPGARNAGKVAAFADGRAESVGESRARLAFDAAGLPDPELQYEIRDRSGKLVARVDFYFPQYRTIVEFDGKIKYTGELTPDVDPADVLWREKKREDRLRTMGFQIVRLTWADLANPQAVGARVRAAFGRHQNSA